MTDLFVLKLLGYCGIAVFAISGALDAARQRMDILGFILIGSAVGLGGGTLRDLLLGVTPVFWVREPGYIGLCIVVTVTTYFVAPHLENQRRALVWMDALGLGLFSVVGARIALDAGSDPLVAVCMGVMTATFGGIIRDVLCSQSLVLGGNELYVTASAVGASTYLILVWLGMSEDPALLGALLVGLALRAGAIRHGWNLPTYGE